MFATLPGPVLRPLMAASLLAGLLLSVAAGTAGAQEEPTTARAREEPGATGAREEPGPHRPLTQWVHRSWSSMNGLPDDFVSDVIQTEDGYLWVGTRDGLARFDGAEFRVYTSENTPALGSNDVRALLESRDGSLWIGTYGGGVTVRAPDGSYRRYRTEEGLAHDVVYSLYEDREGALWIGTGAGLTRYRAGEFRSWTIEDGLLADRVFPVVEDRQGAIWIGTFDGGLNRLADGEMTAFTTEDGLPEESVFALHVDPEGILWVGTYGGGLARLEGGRFVTLTREDGLPDDRINSLYRDGAGLWIGTYGAGLVRLRDGEFEQYGPADGLTGPLVSSVHRGREGVLWVGTMSGLDAFHQGAFVTWSTADGLSHPAAFSVWEDSREAIWIATEGGGLNRLDPSTGEVRVLGVEDGLPGENTVSVRGDREGNLWVGTFGTGLSRIRGDTVQTYRQDDGLESDIVMAIYQAPGAELWLGTFAGVVRRTEGGFRNLSGIAGAPSAPVHAVLEDRRGDLWLGTNGAGLFRLRDGRFTSWKEPDGIGSDLVYALHEDAEGTLWIGTRGGGLTRFSDGGFSTLTTEDGLPENTVFAILHDGLGNLWMCGRRGVARLSLEELRRWEEGGRTDSLEVTLFGRADGLQAGQCNGGTQPSAWQASDGRLWFATPGGAAVVDPARLGPPPESPPVHVEAVVAGDRRLDAGGEVRLETGERSLEVHYTALHFRDPAGVRFRYRLREFDERWVETGSRRVAYYTNLGPGSYRFDVQAADPRSGWSPIVTSGVIVVPPFFHETWWFRLALLALLVAALAGAYRVRVRWHEQQRRELERTVAERTAELHEAQKMEVVGRLAGGIAHDFNNILTTITGNAALLRDHLPDDPEVRKDLGEISTATERAADLTRQLLSFSRRQVLHPREVDLNEALGELRRLLGRVIGEDVDIVVDLVPELPRVHVDPLQLEQIVLNLAINARDAMPSGGTLTLRTRYVLAEEEREIPGPEEVLPAGEYAVVEVSDTGSGMDSETLRQAFEPFFTTKEVGQGTGLGLATVYGIVRQSAGHIVVTSEVGRGTTFTIYFPAAG